MSWFIDDPRERLLILFGLALAEQLLRSKDWEGYPSEVKYEILEALANLQDKFTKVMKTPQFDAYGNRY